MTAPADARVRVVIVDDEPLARDVLRSMLVGEPDVDVVGEAGDGAAAVTLIERLAPDLVFLDIQMPAQDGFAVLRALDPDRMPAITFVTAYSEYAVEAFGVQAMDYLLKPFDDERLADTLRRARTRLGARQAGGWAGPSADDVQRLLQALQGGGAAAPLDRITVREEDRVFFVRTRDVEWFEAASKYVRLHVGAVTHQIREPIGRLEQSLDPRRFVRVSRFAIVNVDRIREMQAWYQGEFVVIMAGGAKITTTRGYRENVNRLLGR